MKSRLYVVRSRLYSAALSDGTMVKASDPPLLPVLPSISVFKRPVFPGFYKTITTTEPSMLDGLTALVKSGNPYLGIFLGKSKSSLEKEASPSSAFSSLDEIHAVGVYAKIINVLPLSAPNSAATAIVYPYRRIRACDILSGESALPCVRAENHIDQPFDQGDQAIRALCQEILTTLAEVAKLSPFFREHITQQSITLSIFEEPAKLADFVAVLCSADVAELQSILESSNVEERLKRAHFLIKKELATVELQASINKEVEQRLNQRQREYFLNEQLRTIKKELGLEVDSKEKLIASFKERASHISMPPNALHVFEEPSSAEFGVSRNYLDWLASLPWGVSKAEQLDVSNAAKILDEDHYGLKDVKERILEFIAVSKLRGSSSGKIVCLVGPPGVGKTSVGKSIAKALGRDYYRFSVGGLSDAAEIKGHRRTYVGAMPGKLVQALKRVQSENPLILIDEIDKIGKGHGDPASALLEILDPEQNSAFLDHYLDVPMDLSKVLFTCTANTLDTIPAPLLDRMEVINLAGYVAQEKLEIARRYLVPNLMAASGLSAGHMSISDPSIQKLIRHYCRENGVRSLKRMLEKICRKAALQYINQAAHSPIVVHAENLGGFVGPPLYLSDRIYDAPLLPTGVSTGLAWTELGGSIIYVETLVDTSIKDAKPGLVRTGQLGKVMEESSLIAYSLAKAHVSSVQPSNSFFEHAAIHMHVPEGATPKDGPSAGCTMAISLVSLATNCPIRSDVAMTGEVTLTGRVLRIGGVKEKIIAAKMAGIRLVIMPATNECDWNELPDYIKENISVQFVDTFSEIAKIVGLPVHEAPQMDN